MLLSALLGALEAPGALLDEIQVYDDAMNAPGAFGVELHLNMTPSGVGDTAYPGEITSVHGYRSTLELSYATGQHFEWGLYFPFEHTGPLSLTSALDEV